MGGEVLNKVLNKFYYWLFGFEEIRLVVLFLKFIEGEGVKKRLGGGIYVNLFFYIEKKSLLGFLFFFNYIVYYWESEILFVLINWYFYLY